MSHPLCTAFLAAARSSGPVPLAQLEHHLETALETARAQWPEVAVEGLTFARFLGERVPAGVAPAEALERLRTADLYLACACAQGSSVAIRVFERELLGGLLSEASRMGLPEAGDEVRQVLANNFFVGRDGQPKAILQYSGAGSLANWVRVSGLRELLKLRRVAARHRPMEDDSLPQALGAPSDPELAHLQEKYRKDFAVAFQEAVGSLTRRERTLLRQHFLDGLSPEEIGALYGVHRSTVWRWLSKVREEVLVRTREQLADRLDVASAELDSILRLVQSRLDLSLRVLLSKDAPDDGER